MKRILCCLVVLILALGCTSCKPKHIHTLGEWTIEEYATCGDSGLQTAVCSECDETVEEVIPPTGEHSYDNQNPTMCHRCFRVEIDDTATLVDLGNAASATYSVGMAANCAWDLKLWNGKLYRGAGNYDTNSGDTLIWYYDIADERWVPTDKVNDEAISRFYVIEDTLMAPGIDPTEDWELGNYYRLGEEGWEKIRKIPDGIHTFDMYEFDGKVFFGLGTPAEVSPVCYTTDHETYTSVPLYKDGTLYDISTDSVHRSYEFFVYNNTLYTLICRNCSDGNRTREFFRYEDDAFVYISDLPQNVSASVLTYNFFDGKCVYNDTYYIASNYLFSTTDFINFQYQPMPDDMCVSDVIVEGKDMYVLCYKQFDEEDFQVVIYKTNGTEFETVYTFDYEIPAHAFEKDGDTYYLSMGGRRLQPNIHAGTVLRLTL